MCALGPPGIHPGTPERPILSAEEDKLERDPFVRRLASALVDGKTGKSRGVVIGITGSWGSGKSSILNLLRERLKADQPEASRRFLRSLADFRSQ
jgi:putative protein kinase ArgK-like GTPase of G3E family